MKINNENQANNETTPEPVYLNRRNFVRMALLGGSVLGTGIGYRYLNPGLPIDRDTSAVPVFGGPDRPNSFDEITNYNNFYEFSSGKTDVSVRARDLTTRPWSVTVGGLVNVPRTFEIEELLALPQGERVYRFRCVEGWSMVIPWTGFPLRSLIEMVEPMATARYVAFESHYDPAIMRSSLRAGIDFPYVEGLRLDEAMHPLTILATGLYGRPMPNQNGAPIRLVVPWKYGFKSIKSIARMTFIEDEPATTWSKASPREYAFYSNVNPEVDHPRWSQRTERRIGEFTRRETFLFNGYADEVAHLYEGMDLKKYF